MGPIGYGELQVTKPRRMRTNDRMAHFVDDYRRRGLTLRRADASEFLEEVHRSPWHVSLNG